MNRYKEIMKSSLLFAVSVLSWGVTRAQEVSIPFVNTIEITPDDTPESIVDKAAHVVPTPNQMAALQNEFIAFIHFGPNTFTCREWGTGKENPEIFALRELYTDQWCEAMKSAGMKMVLLTVKHHDGFVLWQSRYTKHGIMSTGFKEGKGDILRELSESCRKYGLKLGIYLSPADLYQIENPDGLYGNLSKYTKRTIPREVPGRPFANTTRFEFVVDDYNEYFLNQLFELLTEYGPIHEVWFDGAHPKRKGGQTYNYPAWKKLIRTLAPQAVIFGREDVRWCGNEAGQTRKTEWNVIPYSYNPDTASHFADLTAADLGSRDRLGEGKYLHYQQAETNTSIREGWFYRDDTRQRVRSADDIFDIYERSVGGNSTFLLNIPPNREGRFSPADVKALKETGERIRKTYGTNLLAGAKGPEKLLDGNGETYVELTEPAVLEMPAPVTFNRVLLQEPVAARGERVEKHAVDAWVDGEWKEIAAASNIGYKRILRFPDVTAQKIRIRITASRLTPALCNVSLHHYEAQPPMLNCSRSIEGIVSIMPRQSDFGWKAHGEDIAGNLAAGYRIHYTTDGSEPDENSSVYTAPFTMDRGELKAVAILNGRTGTVLHEHMGLTKRNWTVTACSSEADRHGVQLACDENPQTYWKSLPGGSHSITIDLGRKEVLSGFSYTPQQENQEGMMAKGIVLTSTDGKKWREAGIFEFGNLINDPTKRSFYFSKRQKARYVKIETEETAGSSDVVAVAELDFF